MTSKRCVNWLRAAMTFTQRAVCIGLCAALTAVVTQEAYSAASHWINTDFSQTRLIAAHDSVAGREELEIGVHVRLESGWKTYWRHPGDAGIPSEFDWSASENVAQATLVWPAPKRLSFEGLDSFGYEEEVVFPVRIKVRDADAAARVRLHLRYAVCKDICVPLEANLTLDIPTTDSRRLPGTDVHRALIERYRNRVPSLENEDMNIDRAVIVTEGDRRVLRLIASAQASFVNPDVFVEGPGEVFFGRPRLSVSDDGRAVVVELAIDDGGKQVPDARPLRITVVDGKRAIERTLVPTIQ